MDAIGKEQILKIFSYGNDLRNAIEKMTKSGRGALIVFFNNKKMSRILKGGFKINEEFSSERLAELVKLDGAIIVDEKLKKILYANVLLHPDIKIQSSETGTRHQAAERTAKQFNTLVVAVSEKAKTATIYYGNEKIKLNSLNELFTKTGEALKALEKNKDMFEVLVRRLNASETLELVTLEDVSLIFQRKNIINSIAKMLSLYLSELGKEGELIDLQLKEIIHSINREIDLIIKDYEQYFNFDLILKEIENLDYEAVLNKENLFKIFLSHRKKEDALVPKGYRILRNIPILNEENINALIENFPTLRDLILANIEDFTKIKGINEKKARAIKEYLLKAQV